MRDRLVTLALAAGAFALFYALLAPKPPPPQERVTRPTSAETGPNGYYALQRWLADAGVEVVSLRERFGRIDEAASSRTGNLLITTAPHFYPLRHSETRPLRAWIARGNTLLVVAALSDTPDWTMEGKDPAFLENMEEMTGLTFVAKEEDVEQSSAAGSSEEASDAQRQEGAEDGRGAGQPAFIPYDEPLRFELKPSGAHPLLEGVRTVGALSEYPTSKWYAVVRPDRLLLELAHDPESGAPVLWLLRYGEGRILISGYGSIFTNKLLGKDDNARLLANIVDWSLGPGGAVLIDDAHQGLVAFYDPDAFFGDARLHTTIWWLLALWLVFVLGPRPFRTTGEQWSPVDVLSFVRATGGFLARTVRPPAVAQQLFANFFNELRRRCGLPTNGAPLWDWLAAQATVPQRDIAELKALHARAARGARIDLVRVQTLLARTRACLR
jgi:hypothetical protein